MKGKGHDGNQYGGYRGSHFFITRGSPGNCQIANGTDVNAKMQRGDTPLHEAAYHGRVDLAKLLIDKGADVDAKDKNGGTPLYWAAEGGHMDVAKLLIARGTDVNAKMQRGDTPLYVAAMRGRVAVAELLIAKGADVNTKVQAEGVAGTPLHEAAYHGNVDLAQLLITKGAEINAKDQNGNTPLDIAAQNGHKDIVELLRQHLYKGKPPKPQDMIKKDKDLGSIEGATGQEPKADRVENSKNNEALPAASADTPPIKTGDTYIFEFRLFEL
jgi:ankyrin repeat protein